MLFTKVSVDRVYKKTGSPTEKKDRHVRQVADEIFADLFPSCLSNNNPDGWTMPEGLGLKRVARKILNKK